MNKKLTVDRLIANFSMFSDWEDRYRYLIDLGRKLPEMPEGAKVDRNKVEGCMSQVWLISDKSEDQPPVIRFRGDSDAHIVKGLIAVLLAAYSEKTPQQILETDIGGLFENLGLGSHLSVNRRNGFYAMTQRIKEIAAQAA